MAEQNLDVIGRVAVHLELVSDVYVEAGATPPTFTTADQRGTTKAALPYFPSEGGSVINISSVVSSLPPLWRPCTQRLLRVPCPFLRRMTPAGLPARRSSFPAELQFEAKEAVRAVGKLNSARSCYASA